VAQAQNDIEINSNNIESTLSTTVADDMAPKTTDNNELVSAADLKESIARTNSDIRVYFSRVTKKKVDNITLLFPKIHKKERA